MIKKKKIENKNKVVGKFSDSEFYFDDCTICQGMKAAEERGKGLNLDELNMLFKKANKNQKKKI